jgi:hypothetical protein
MPRKCKSPLIFINEKECLVTETVVSLQQVISNLMELIHRLNNFNDDGDGLIVDSLLASVTNLLKVVTMLQDKEHGK